MRGFALFLFLAVTGCSAEVGEPQTPSASNDAGGGAETGTGKTGFAGCTSFEDRTAAGAERSIGFAGSAYTPKCMRIKKGQSVSIDASSFHPMEPAPGNPSGELAASADAKVTRTLTVTGVYGYFCPHHGSGSGSGSGMAGAIEVVD